MGTTHSDIGWARVDLSKVPHRASTGIPGPRSRELHARGAAIMKGYSSQVRLFPVVFAKGHGCTLTDVDGNTYFDCSAGIHVTSLGHCHPKVTEAVQRAAGELMNCHDFNTPVKVRLPEKMKEILPEGLCAVQLYDSGATAIEAGIRVCRAAAKEPFVDAGVFVYQAAFRKGLAWIPAGHILRMSPPIIMDLDVAARCMDIIDEAIGEAEKHFGHTRA